MRTKIQDKISVKSRTTRKETKGATKTNVSRFNPTINAWSKGEDKILLLNMSKATNMSKTARELTSILKNRTVDAIKTRYRTLSIKSKEESKLDISYIGNVVPSYIPETNIPTYLSQEQVTMYKAELAESLHEKAEDAVKANVRAITDSIPDKEVDDRTIHLWFNENKNKIEYLMSISAEELWNI